MHEETATDGDAEYLELKVETEVMGDSVGWNTAEKHSSIIFDAVHFTSGAGTLSHKRKKSKLFVKRTEKWTTHIHANTYCV